MKKGLTLMLLGMAAAASLGQTGSYGFDQKIFKSSSARNQKHVPSALRRTEAAKLKIDSIVTQLNDPEESRWTIEKTYYFYNAAGQVIQEEGHNTDTSGYRYLSYLSTYAYDNAGRLTLETYTDFTEDTLRFGSKYEYIYNIQGLKIAEKNYSLDQKTMNWTLNNEKRFRYADSRLLADSSLIYNSISDTSYLSWKTAYIYDAAGNNIRSLEYRWDDSQQALGLLSRVREYAFNSQGREVSETEYSAYNPQDTLTPIYKEESTWDLQGNLLEVYSYYYDRDSLAWVPDLHNVFSIDYSYTADQILFLPYYKEMFANKVNSGRAYVVTEGGPYLARLDSLYYSPFVITSLADQSTSEEVYYDQSSGNLIIHNAGAAHRELSIFDIQGRQVARLSPEGNSISLGTLPKGLFLYRLSESGREITGKLLIK